MWLRARAQRDKRGLSDEDKENEIAAILQLLDKLDIDEGAVSIDAIGTQVDIAQDILDKRAHCFLAVKENQGALHEAIINTFRCNRPLDTATQMKTDRGCIGIRDCRILDVGAIEEKEVAKRWPELKTLAEITSTVDYGDKAAKTTRLYKRRRFSQSRPFQHIGKRTLVEEMEGVIAPCTPGRSREPRRWCPCRLSGLGRCRPRLSTG